MFGLFRKPNPPTMRDLLRKAGREGYFSYKGLTPEEARLADEAVRLGYLEVLDGDWFEPDWFLLTGEGQDYL